MTLPGEGSTHSHRTTLAEALRSGPLGPRSYAGLTLGPYQVESLVAKGGMGAVFRAFDLRTRQPVALKILLQGKEASQVHKRRSQREVALMQAMDHEGIVNILDHGEVDGDPWLAMDYVEGVTLAEVLRGTPVRSLVKMMVRIARAIGHCHDQGVIHRDLKPANVLIRHDHRPVVTDFGIARDMSLSSSLTRTGASMGTPLYMAPEQGAGEDATCATDVYALGTILYEGLVGEPPFDASDGVLALYHAIEKNPPQPPSHRNPNLPRSLDAVVLKALEKDPTRRYPNGNALADELEDFLEGRLATRRGSKRPLLAFGAVGLGLLVAGVSWFALGGSEPPPEESPPEAQITRRATPPDPEPDPTPPQPGPQRVEIQPGPLLGKDTGVRNDGWYWNDNSGSSPGLILGDRASQRGDFRVYLQLDLERIPREAKIDKATLRLWVASSAELRKPLPVTAQRVVATRRNGVALTPWVEGTTSIDRFVDGMVWDGDLEIGRFPQSRSRRPELSQPNADPAVLDRVTVHPGQTGWVELDVTPAAARWVADPSSNFGLRIAHQPEGRPWDNGRLTLTSSDHRTSIRRPTLVVRYTGAPPAPAPILARVESERRAAATRHLQVVVQEGNRPTERALAAAQKAVETDPTWGEARFIRGRLRIGVDLTPRDPGPAMRDLELADAVSDPFEDPLLIVTRADLLLRANLPKQAHDQVVAGLKRGEDPRLRRLQVLALRALDRGAEAETALKAALARHPGDPQLRALKRP